MAEELCVDEPVLFRVSGASQEEIGFGLLKGEGYRAGAVG